MEEQQELPQGWAWTTVEELCEICSGQTPNGVTETPGDGEFPWFRVGDMNSIGNEKYLINAAVKLTQAELERFSIRLRPAGTIVFPKRGGAIATNKKRILGQPSAFDLNSMGLKARVGEGYFWHWFSALDLSTISDGSNVPQINNGDILPLLVPLPPLPEQQRIVAKLEELFSKLDAGVAAVRRTQALLKRYRQSVLHAAVTGELTRAWREAHPAPAETGAVLLERIRTERRAQWEAAQVVKRGGQLTLGAGWKSKYVEPEAVDVAGLPELPTGWTWVRLELLTSVITKGASPTWQGFNYVDEEQVLFVTSENVRSGFLDVSRPKYLEWAFNNKQKASILQEGDLLLNIVGASIGRAAMYNISRSANINQAVSLIRLTLADLREYVMLFLNSNQAIQFYNSEKVDVARANLSLKDVANIPVALPPSFEELEAVLQEMQRRLSVIGSLELTLTDELKRAERLRQSILHRAFTGRLVPQDATDEPAATLLARLRETPAASAKTKAGRGRKAVAQQTTLGL